MAFFDALMQDYAQFDQKIVAGSFGSKRAGRAAEQTETLGRHLSRARNSLIDGGHDLHG